MNSWYCYNCDALLITEESILPECFYCGSEMTSIVPLEYAEESIYNAPTLVSC